MFFGNKLSTAFCCWTNSSTEFFFFLVLILLRFAGAFFLSCFSVLCSVLFAFHFAKMHFRIFIRNAKNRSLFRFKLRSVPFGRCIEMKINRSIERAREKERKKNHKFISNIDSYSFASLLFSLSLSFDIARAYVEVHGQENNRQKFIFDFSSSPVRDIREWIKWPLAFSLQNKCNEKEPTHTLAHTHTYSSMNRCRRRKPETHSGLNRCRDEENQTILWIEKYFADGSEATEKRSTQPTTTTSRFCLVVDEKSTRN